MTQFSRTILQCSECNLGRVVKYKGGCYGGISPKDYWTDGKENEIGSPKLLFAKCNYCKAFLWVDELKRGNQYKGWTEQAILRVEDYFNELKTNNLDKEKEKALRMEAWWVGNNQSRWSSMKFKLANNEIENLLQLNEILDVSYDNECIIKAEIMRELGQFEKAKELINKPFLDRFSWLAKDPIIADYFLEKYAYYQGFYHPANDLFSPRSLKSLHAIKNFVNLKKRYESLYPATSCAEDYNHNYWKYWPSVDEHLSRMQVRSWYIFTIKTLIQKRYSFVATLMDARAS